MKTTVMKIIRKSGLYLLIFIAIIIALIVFVTGIGNLRFAQAKAGIGDVIKGGAIAVAVRQFGDELNDFLNTVTVNNNVPANADTKVVPIISAGSGAYVGAAQVIGTRDAVAKVNAVVQFEANFKARMFRAKVLVPVQAESAKDLDRVEGVGISAVVDVKL